MNSLRPLPSYDFAVPVVHGLMVISAWRSGWMVPTMPILASMLVRLAHEIAGLGFGVLHQAFVKAIQLGLSFTIRAVLL